MSSVRVKVQASIYDFQVGYKHPSKHACINSWFLITILRLNKREYRYQEWVNHTSKQS